MNFDFALVLVIITAVSGLIWLVDSLFFARNRMAAFSAEPNTNNAEESASATTDEPYREPVLVEYARSFFPVLLVVLILRSFLFEPFRIPSGSMLPTLLIGDFILVQKFSYGVRLPVVNTKLFDTGSPDRGDVAVFRFPKDPNIDFIKRIVALPGDTIRYKDKQLTVNGVVMPLQDPAPYESPDDEGKPDPSLLRLTEKFDNVAHDILIAPHVVGSRAAYAVNSDYTVPEGHYFVMGDNRDNSNDSRYWGVVPETHLVGKAVLIWMNLNLHWDRLGSSIK